MRPDWPPTNAERFQHPVLFTIPDTRKSADIVDEVVAGNRRYLRDPEGRKVLWYSLAGAATSMKWLIRCTRHLAHGEHPGG